METLLFAGVPVADYGAALVWYSRLFGRAPDVDVHATEAMWQISAGGWLYVVADASRAGHALVTVLVSDLDGWLAGLAERGITHAPIESAPGLYRKAAILDPDGNMISFGVSVQGSV